MLAFHESDHRPSPAQIAAMKDGEKGIDEGHKPHIRDAMTIIKSIWNDTISMENIQRCWVKSDCLPFAAQSHLRDLVGDSERKIAHTNLHLPVKLKDDINELCDIVSSLSTKLEGDERDLCNASREELEYGLQTWCFIEDEQWMVEELIADAMEEEEMAPRTASSTSSTPSSTAPLSFTVVVSPQTDTNVGEVGRKREREPALLSTPSAPAAQHKRAKQQSSINQFFSPPAAQSSTIVISPTTPTLPTISATAVDPLLAIGGDDDICTYDEYRVVHGIPMTCYGEPAANFTSRFEVVRVTGDGNCFYHALAYLLDRRDDPKRFRAMIADEIRHNRHAYEEYIDVPLEEYLHGIIHRKQWADEVEINAAERLFGQPIVVYNAEGKLTRSLNEDINIRKNPKPLYFRRIGVHESEKHYDALKDTNEV